jgi:DNA-directed RNA polymerase subunit alpha
MKWKNLTMPKQVMPDEGNTDRYGKFTIEPLERGFGLTLGNALRRVLLSSLQGAAITAVRIDGVLHEFSTLPGVIEDVTEIILNLKQVRLKLHGDGPKKGTFEMRGKSEVRAGDLQVDGEVMVLNPDLHIATLNKDAGPAHGSGDLGGGRIIQNRTAFADRASDRRASDRFAVLAGAQGQLQRRDHATRSAHRLRQADDRSVDRRQHPSVGRGGCGGQDPPRSFQPVHPLRGADREEEVEEEVNRTSCASASCSRRASKAPSSPVHARCKNCLRAAEIKSIGDLVQKSEGEMLKYRNFGRKSLKEIQDILGEMGLSFGMDVTPYYEGKDAVRLDA